MRPSTAGPETAYLAVAVPGRPLAGLLPVKQPGQNAFCPAQNQIMQRRGIRNNDAHERARILSRVALSEARSADE